MRTFTLYINNEARGPFTEEEVVQLLTSGDIKGETLGALAGSENWVHIAELIKFGTTIKLSNDGKDLTTNEAPTLSAVDRRKLLTYGLATNATVEQFTPEQAHAHIEEHEARIQTILRSRKIITVSVFAFFLLSATCFGIFTESGSRLVGRLVQTFAHKEDAKLTDTQQRFETEIKRFEKLNADIQKIKFDKPRGAVNPKYTLLNRVQVPSNSGFKITGTIDCAPLKELLAQSEAKPDESLRLYILNSEMPRDILRKVNQQIATLEAIVAPAMNDADIERLRYDAIMSFPNNSRFPESARLQSEISNPKTVNDISGVIKKVTERAKTAAKSGESNNKASNSANDIARASKQWSEELYAYVDRLNDFQRLERLNSRPKERKNAWSEFNAKDGAEITAWLLASNTKEIPVNAEGQFTIPESPRLSLNNGNSQILIATKVGGDTLYLNWNSRYLFIRDFESNEMPREVFVDREQYKIVDRITTGGVSLVARAHVGNRDLTIRRVSPKWYFMRVARENDSDSLLFMADKETFEKYNTLGQVVPASTLAKLEIYANPCESITPSSLTPRE
ncbi:MAG: hypothetical protein WCL22_03035 [bacterium]